MRKYVVALLITVVVLTGSISALCLGQSTAPSNASRTPDNATTSTTSPPAGETPAVSPSRPMLTSAPPGLAASVGLIALANRQTAALVRRASGKRALWAWRVAKQTFSSIVNFAVSPGTRLYAERRTLRAAIRRFRPTRGATTTTEPIPTSTAAPSAPVSTPAPVSGSGPLEPSGVAGSWNLIFDDEFNESSLDTSEWTPYWFSNGSTSNETTMVQSNVSVSDGDLDLGLDGSGGLVSTNGHFSFTYGFVEVRAYIPASDNEVANWPAIWAVGQDWPTDGELDIMEGLGGRACYHFHSDAGGPGGCPSGNYTGWHTFGADWQPGSVTFYYDGADVGTITEGITSDPMYLILENSGGILGGPSLQPSTMEIDYVRVWSGS